MFPYLILGICLLGAAILLLKWFANTTPANAWKAVKWAAFITTSAVVIFLLVTGRFAQALFALPVYLPFIIGLLRRFAMYRMAGSLGGSGGSRAKPGQHSSVETAWLAMELDHDSGQMDGEILQGRFAGSRLSDVGLDDLLSLLGELDSADEESADLLEAYLDRQYPDWREETGAEQSESRERTRTGSSGGEMNRAKALEILGLEENATADDVRAAHKRMMKFAHPDHGGSNYLASRINEAKEYLLSSL
jgi:hypothetical protein